VKLAVTCDMYSDPESRRPETPVTDAADSPARTAVPDTVASTAAPPAVEGTTETECSDVPGRPHSVGADNKNCSTREAIVRSSQITGLLASKTFRW